MVGRCRDCDLTWTSFVVDSRPTSLSPTPPRTRPKPPWMESWAFRPVATCTALERFCGPGAWPGRPGPKHRPQSGERQPSRQLRVNEVSPSAPSHHHGCCPTGGQDEVQLGSRPSGIQPSGVVSSVSKQLNHRSNAQKIDGWESSVHPPAISDSFRCSTTCIWFLSPGHCCASNPRPYVPLFFSAHGPGSSRATRSHSHSRRRSFMPSGRRP